jgi:protein-tyrosine phosphatase
LGFKSLHRLLEGSKPPEGGYKDALFHCTGGKDRNGWAAAAFLTLLGVPRETVMEDYLRSNEYSIPKNQKVIGAFVKGGGDPSIPLACLPAGSPAGSLP